MRISKNSKLESVRITAADEDWDVDDINDDNIDDSINEISDQIEDLQNTVDDQITKDEPKIEVENNIEGHYIAECEVCSGVFISPVMESEEDIEKVSGVCPICGKESDQYLKWVIKRAGYNGI